MVTLGIPLSDDGSWDEYSLIREEIARTAGHVRWLETTVGDLEQGELAWGLSAEEITELEEATVGGAAGTGSKTGRIVVTKRAAALNVHYQMYAAERKHLVECCAAAVRLGLAEREVIVTESVAAAFIDSLQAGLRDPAAALTADQQDIIWHAVEVQLRAPRLALPVVATTRAVSSRAVP